MGTRAGRVAREVADAKTPLFVVGMHRSGTTLLEQLLSASPQVLGLGELNDFTSAMRYESDHYCKGALDLAIVQRALGIDFDAVGERYMGGVAWRLGEAPFFADKQPSNYLNIGFICQALPHAKILHMVRDPVETCFSNLRELFTESIPIPTIRRSWPTTIFNIGDLCRIGMRRFPGDHGRGLRTFDRRSRCHDA